MNSKFWIIQVATLLFTITASPSQPSQVHLALSDNGMSVMWITTINTTSNVIYGTDPTNLNLTTATATTTTYQSPGIIYTSEMDLVAHKIPLSTEIYYQVGNN